MLDRAYTPVELARRWRRRPSAVRALIRAGQLRAFAFGDRVRIPPEAVEEYERAHAVVERKAIRKRRQRKPDWFVEYF